MPTTKKKPAAKAKTAKAVAKPAKKTAARKPVPKPQAKPAAAKPAAVKSTVVKPAMVKSAVAKPAVSPVAQAKPASPPKPASVTVKAVAPTPLLAPQKAAAAPVQAVQPRKLVFKVNELVVYPAHGVGRVVQVEEQEIAGARLELYIIDFDKEKLRLKVPTAKAALKGMRKIADRGLVEEAMKILRGRARIKRTMWSRRAQEYEAKINSGDLFAVAEVVRDLFRSERATEQSYSERQLFEQALERMAREVAAVKKIDDDIATKEIEDFLAKNSHRAPAKAGPEAEEELQAEEAA